MHLLVDAQEGRIAVTRLDRFGRAAGETILLDRDRFPGAVREHERERPRWVWSGTEEWYPALLAAGVRVERCVDLRLSRAILRLSPLSAGSALAASPADGWDRPPEPQTADDGLFSLSAPPVPLDAAAEFRRQREAVSRSTDPGRLELLLATESAGSLVAAELHETGLPWRADLHEELLVSLLGPRPRPGERPAKLALLVDRLREVLGAPELNPDSQAELLRALQRAGLRVRSTREWELRELTHPAIEPLLRYKKLARLQSANGWHWLETNVVAGRFRPDYVVGGVVTGRWASRGGGGALQLPKQVRTAVVADAGWRLVVADAGQLEPRILAALSGDAAMARASRAHDLYAEIVASGGLESRDQAKLALLGALYGATSGDSGRLMPALARAFPRAIGAVEDAARTGERGGVVSTWLGRGSPRPGAEWWELQQSASDPDAGEREASRARSVSRSWGRFTRNFVVQGTAAEWAMIWMALIRTALRRIAPAALPMEPHLAFFLHDEVVVHTPAEHAEAVTRVLEESAAEAGRLLFGDSGVEFPLSVSIVECYADAG